MEQMKIKLVHLLALTLTLFSSLQLSAEEGVTTYKVVGIVKALPGNGRAANELLVKHEAIPEYRDSSGKVVGMHAMTMPFYLSPKASLTGISVGDGIEMTVESRLKPSFTEEVTAITKR